MTRATKIYFVIAAILLFYGYMCRILNIYFFWDSKYLGWVIAGMGISNWVIWRIFPKRFHRDFKIVIICDTLMFLFYMVVCVAMSVSVREEEAYQTALESIRQDSAIISKVGTVKGFGLIPFGTVNTFIMNGAESGEATFTILVRGSRKNADLKVYLEKADTTFWRITYVE